MSTCRHIYVYLKTYSCQVFDISCNFVSLSVFLYFFYSFIFLQFKNLLLKILFFCTPQKTNPLFYSKVLLFKILNRPVVHITRIVHCTENPCHINPLFSVHFQLHSWYASFVFQFFSLSFHGMIIVGCKRISISQFLSGFIFLFLFNSCILQTSKIIKRKKEQRKSNEKINIRKS